MGSGAKLGGGGGRNFENEKDFEWFAPEPWKGLTDYEGLDFNELLGDQLLAPELERAFATSARDLKTSYNSPYGSEQGAEERQQGYRDSLLQLNEVRSGATEQANFDRSRLLAGLEAQRGANIAGLTRPELQNTGEKGFGMNPDGGFWGSLKKGLGGALAGAGAAFI